ERGNDLAEDRVHDVLDVALVEMRVLRGYALNKLRLDHLVMLALGMNRSTWLSGLLRQPNQRTIHSLILGRRVPKRQQPVKIELFGRLQQPKLLQPLRHRTEADGFEQRRRAEVQERQFAEARGQAPVADRRLRVDVVRLDEPRDRIALLADLVGE